MRILLINPNSSAHITEGFAKSLPVDSDVQLETFTAPLPAPTSIESVITSVQSAHIAYQALLPRLLNYDGFLICCFSAHPLIEMLRETTTAPVIGIMESSLHLAMQLGHKVGIVTTAKRWEPLLTLGIQSIGLQSDRIVVKSSSLGVLELHSKSQAEVQLALKRAAESLCSMHNAEVIVLGCAGMSGLEQAIAESDITAHIPIIDSVQAGHQTLVALCRLRLGTSKAGLYA